MIDFLPAPIDVSAIMGINEDGHEDERHPDDKDPFSALAFKIATDPFVGNLTFFRVYSGVLSSGDMVFNPIKDRKNGSAASCRCIRMIARRSRKCSRVTSLRRSGSRT